MLSMLGGIPILAAASTAGTLTTRLYHDAERTQPMSTIPDSTTPLPLSIQTPTGCVVTVTGDYSTSECDPDTGWMRIQTWYDAACTQLKWSTEKAVNSYALDVGTFPIESGEVFRAAEEGQPYIEYTCTAGPSPPPRPSSPPPPPSPPAPPPPPFPAGTLTLRNYADAELTQPQSTITHPNLITPTPLPVIIQTPSGCVPGLLGGYSTLECDPGTGWMRVQSWADPACTQLTWSSEKAVNDYALDVGTFPLASGEAYLAANETEPYSVWTCTSAPPPSLPPSPPPSPPAYPASHQSNVVITMSAEGEVSDYDQLTCPGGGNVCETKLTLKEELVRRMSAELGVDSASVTVEILPGSVTLKFVVAGLTGSGASTVALRAEQQLGTGTFKPALAAACQSHASPRLCPCPCPCTCTCTCSDRAHATGRRRCRPRPGNRRPRCASPRRARGSDRDLFSTSARGADRGPVSASAPPSGHIDAQVVLRCRAQAADVHNPRLDHAAAPDHSNAVGLRPGCHGGLSDLRV